MNKLTDNIQANAEIDAINEIIDHLNTRDLGQIIPSTIPLTDAGLHLLDGALIQGSGIYSAFVTYIAGLVNDYPDCFETEANWQSAVATYGVCGKFVYDSVANTVRLPKYSNKIYTKSMANTVPVIGNGLGIGTTNGSLERNIYINVNGIMVNDFPTRTPIGASNSSIGTFPTWQSIGLSQNPDNSGIIADLANITTSLDGYYYIVIATTTKTEIEVDIDEIATDLNGKCDVDGSNATFPHIVETYVNGTSWYNVYSNGWCEQGGYDAEGTVDYGVHTIEFLKPYVDTNYTLTAWYESYYSSAANVPIGMVAYRNKQTASFQRLTSTTTYRAGCSWEAKGYIS